jgi:hypothetical protein
MIYPGSAGRAARPSGGLFRFWAVILLNPNQLGIPPAKAGEVKFPDPASAAGVERRLGQRRISASDLDRTDYGSQLVYTSSITRSDALECLRVSKLQRIPSEPYQGGSHESHRSHVSEGRGR